MTVNVASTKVQYNGNGTTGPFTYAFKILEDSDLLIIVKGTDGTESTLTLNTDYTVAGAGVDAGGTITLTSGALCATGETLTIMRNMDLLQDTDMVDGDAFSAESVEDALDKETMTMQQLDERCDRAVSFPKGGDAIGNEIDGTQFESRANKTLGFNALGQLALLPVSISAVTLASAYYVDVADYSGDLTALVATLGGTVADILIDSAAHTTGATNIGDNLNLIVTKKGIIDTTLGAVTGLKIATPEMFGAARDRTTDDTAAVQAAVNAVSGVIYNSTGGKCIFSGAYLVSSTITVPWGVDVVFEGSHSNAPNTPPTAYLYKKATMTTPALVFQDNTQGHNVGVVYASGATGDGIQILGNSVRLYNPTVAGVGLGTTSGDGIRIGQDAAGANCNSWYLENPQVSGMSGYGIYVSDKTSPTQPDANAGTMIKPVTNLNGLDGIRFGNAWNNTVIAPLAEGNGGVGLRLTANAHNTTIIGGDTNEANASGTLALDSGATYNTIIGGDHHNIIDSSAERNFIWQAVPVINYSSVAWTTSGTQPDIGNGTLTASYSRSGTHVSVNIDLTTGTTTTFGTGDFRFSIPRAPLSKAVQLGTVRITHDGETRVGVAIATVSTAYVVIQVHGANGNASATIPWTWDAADNINIQIEYEL